MKDNQGSRPIDLKQLSEATNIPVEVLRRKYDKVRIDQNFDVDAFLSQIQQMQDGIEDTEEADEQEVVSLNCDSAFKPLQSQNSEDEEINRQIDEIMKKEKQEEILGVGKISFKYKQQEKVDLGLTAEEMLTLNEVVLDYLVKGGKVDLAVYKRLKEEGHIKGDKFDVSKVKAYTGNFEPLKRHQKLQLDKKTKLELRKAKNRGYWQQKKAEWRTQKAKDQNAPDETQKQE